MLNQVKKHIPFIPFFMYVVSHILFCQSCSVSVFKKSVCFGSLCLQIFFVVYFDSDLVIHDTSMLYRNTFG